MSSHFIYLYLRTLYNTISNIEKAYLNQPYEPQFNTPWLREDFLPVENQDLFLKYDAKLEFKGIYQITAFYPEKNGVHTSATKVSEILTIFKRGTEILNNGIIEQASVSQSFKDEVWFVTPINIRYRVWL